MQLSKKILLAVLAIIFLFTSKFTFSQKKVSVSNKRTDTVKTSGSYFAVVYFYGNGMPNTITSTFYASDLDSLMKTIERISKGANVSFEYLKYRDSKGVTKEIKEIPYNFNKPKDKVQFKSQSVLEVEKLKALNFVSGTIYFAGFGFNNVSSTKASDTLTLYKYYDRSGPGTTITLDNCIYKNVNGSLSNPLSKSVKLE